MLSRVDVGRDNNPNLVDEDPWSIASDADRADEADGSFASWEGEDEDADRLSDPLADRLSDPLADRLSDPLANPGREPDFVFTLGAGTSDAEPDAASDDIGEYRRTAGAKAYTLEKRRRPIGDAVTDRTQRDPSVAADARAAADAAKRVAARSAGVVADVHTNITVLFPETFDAATALARRPSDGVGLDRAGGLVGDAETSSDSGSRGSADGSRKRRWLVAFCARWAPPCNLLVREFALLGSDPALREFALGWVDCTPASMTHFCGARFAVEGYPSVYLITGGRGHTPPRPRTTRARHLAVGRRGSAARGPSRAERRRAGAGVPRASADGRARTPGGGTERRARVQRGERARGASKRTRTDAGGIRRRGGATREAEKDERGGGRRRGGEEKGDEGQGRGGDHHGAEDEQTARGEGGGQGEAGESRRG